MKKKKGKAEYDDFFSNGIMEIGRMGNVVTLKNNMSEEQAEKNRERMANDYAEKKAEIDNLIDISKKEIVLSDASYEIMHYM